MNRQEERYVKKLYYDVREGGSYGGFEALYQKIKREGRYNIKKKVLREFMQGEETFTSHQSKQKLKHYAKIIAPHPNYGVEFDSAFMPFPEQNKLKYAIVGVDIFSHRVGVRAVASLKGEIVNRAVNEIIDELGGHFSQLRSDRGGEYVGAPMKATLRRRNIRHVLAYEPLKAPYAENNIRLLKRKMYKIMQHHGEHNWSRYIKDVVYSLNHTKSPTLGGISPVEVTDDKVAGIWFRRMHDDLKTQPKFKEYEYKVNDTVKIHYSRGQAFRKEFNERMGAKAYYIEERFSPGQNHLYKVRDDRGNILPGRFKSNELEKVVITPDTPWRIEGKPLAYRNNRREALVKWLDHDESYNSWVPTRDVVSLRGRRQPPVRGRRRRAPFGGRRRRRP